MFPKWNSHPLPAFQEISICLTRKRLSPTSLRLPLILIASIRSPSPYPVNGNASILRTILPNSLRVRWLSANSSQ